MTAFTQESGQIGADTGTSSTSITIPPSRSSRVPRSRVARDTVPAAIPLRILPSYLHPSNPRVIDTDEEISRRLISPFPRVSRTQLATVSLSLVHGKSCGRCYYIPSTSRHIIISAQTFVGRFLLRFILHLANVEQAMTKNRCDDVLIKY